MAEVDWTQAETIVCPDCGYVFGTRTAAQSIKLTFDPKGLRSQCVRMIDPSSSDLRCPRFDEVKLASDQSERVHPVDPSPRS
jgi:hypothetical protein